MSPVIPYTFTYLWYTHGSMLRSSFSTYMGSTAMRTANSKIKTTTQRAKLSVRAAPHFDTVARKRLLGYVRGAAALAGHWVVQVEIGRTATGQPVRRREQLGIAD